MGNRTGYVKPSPNIKVPKIGGDDDTGRVPAIKKEKQRTIAEIKEIIKTTIQQTLFPLIRTFTLTAFELTAEAVWLTRDGTNVTQIKETKSNDIILKATRNASHDFTLEFDNGGALAKVGRANNEGASLYSNNQSIADSTYTALTFNTVVYDTDNMYDAGNPTLLTCKTAGKYLIIASVTFAHNTTGVRRLFIEIDQGYGGGRGAEDTRPALPYSPPPTLYGVTLYVSMIMDMAVNDTAELWVWQDSGAALNSVQVPWSAPSFYIQRIDG